MNHSTKDDLHQWLMNLRQQNGDSGPLPVYHWAIINKFIELRGCICTPEVTHDDLGAHWIHKPECGLPSSPADSGPEDYGQSQGCSTLAVVLATAINRCPPITTIPSNEAIARRIDERLTDIRNQYEREELSRCPVVSHHGRLPCAFCLTAAMRAFILLPEEKL